MRTVDLMGRNPRHLPEALHNLTKKRSGTVTLTASATTTTVTDKSITSESVIALMPTTANAAAALGTTYVSARSKGSFTLTHANNAQTDRTFGWCAGID